MISPPQTGYITLKEAALRLGIYPDTAGKWARSGRLPGAFRLTPTDWRVDVRILEEWLQERTA